MEAVMGKLSVGNARCNTAKAKMSEEFQRRYRIEKINACPGQTVPIEDVAGLLGISHQEVYARVVGGELVFICRSQTPEVLITSLKRQPECLQ
jgi:hypothetical protein